MVTTTGATDTCAQPGPLPARIIPAVQVDAQTVLVAMLSGVHAPLQQACDRTVIVAQPPLHELWARAAAPGTPETGPLGPA